MRLPERFEDGLGYLIHHLLYAFRQGFSRECARLGINVTLEEMAVLVLLSECNGLSHTELADKLAKDKAVITRILAKLNGKGLVSRRTDRKDRRIVRAYLSENGRSAFDQLLPLLQNFLRRALQGVSQRDFDTTRRVLRGIIDNLRV
jgi:DNA-binding MarR family transcriptional regulator